MKRLINRAVVEHLVGINHRDLAFGIVTPRLIEAAGDAIADLMLDHGFRLEDSYVDGNDIVHCYINPRTGEMLDEVGFSLGLVQGPTDGFSLAVLLRTKDAQMVACEGFSVPVRSARSWYLPLSNSATAGDFIAGASGRESHPTLEWRAAA